MQGSDPGLTIQAGFLDPSPYPEIVALQPNISFARLLMDDFAGIVSEFSLINQYLYHYFVIDEPEICKTLRNIAAAEMHHMTILAKLIKMLGGNPVYRSGSGNYWHSKYIYCGSQLSDRIRVDIDTEQRAINCYNLHIDMIDDPPIKKMLERIILDEELHIRLLKDISSAVYFVN